MKQIVIGLGEVGRALKTILECDGYDSVTPLKELRNKYDVIHIAFPYTHGNFADSVKAYQERTGASLVIVHSTVPMDTCNPHGWVHSPIRGVHPELERGIRTFVKFFGCKNEADAVVAAGIFQEKGIKTLVFDSACDTEAMKLWDTTQYGWDILIQKAIMKFCDQYGRDFEAVYTLANATYNEGYARLGMPQYSRYVLKHKDGPIGGHCVRENWELLADPIAVFSKDLHKRIIDSGEAV